MYVMNTVLFYSEVQHKLGYIWLSKCPTKREVKHTLKYLNTTSEVIGNSYSLYKTGSILKPEKEAAKLNKAKKKLSHPNSRMGKRYKYLCNLYDLQVTIPICEWRERKREKLKQKLDKHRAKKEDDFDKQDEALMKTYGYHRCNSCKLYSSPDRMLESVASASLKVANESKKFSPDEILELQKLIMNSGEPEPVEKKELEKYKLVLNKVSVKCGDCESLFNDNKCECGGAAMFCVDSVIKLQTQQIALYHAYQHRLDIELEHKMVSK
jgi:hypothetical protein